MIEATPIAAASGVVRTWLPPPAPHHLTTRRSQALQPLLTAAAARLSAVFACPVELAPAGEGDRNLPPAAATLAGLRLGGAVQALPATGAVVLHYHEALAQELQPVVDRLWPPAEAPAPLAMVLILTPDSVAPLRLAIELPAPALAPRPAVGRGLAGDLPLRLRVELASQVMAAASLLPLQPGLVLPVTALAEMPVRLGDHCIGRATVVPLPDGRQQATIVAIDIHRQGEA